MARAGLRSIAGARCSSSALINSADKNVCELPWPDRCRIGGRQHVAVPIVGDLDLAISLCRQIVAGCGFASCAEHQFGVVNSSLVHQERGLVTEPLRPFSMRRAQPEHATANHIPAADSPKSRDFSYSPIATSPAVRLTLMTSEAGSPLFYGARTAVDVPDSEPGTTSKRSGTMATTGSVAQRRDRLT